MDTSKWFRPPKLVEVESVDDIYRGLWVAEPTVGEIYGKAFEVPRSLEVRMGWGWVDGLKRAALDDLMYRIGKLEFRRAEGSEWKEFL